MPPTIADVSRQVGYSSATVSRVLNNSAPVSSHIREKVLHAARQTGYLARRHQRSSPDSRSTSLEGNLIEVVWHWRSRAEPVQITDRQIDVGPLESLGNASPLTKPNLTSSFYREILDGVLDELRQWGQKAIIQSNHNLLDPALLADINRPDYRGVLLIGEHTPELSAFIEQCTRPLVLVDLIARSWPDVVTIGNAEGVGSAFRHVYELGHRNIGFVGADPANPVFIERRTAFEWCMLQSNLPVRRDWIYEGSGHIQHTADGVAAILRRPSRPTALVCCNDNAAMGVYRAADACGLSIPGDLSVVGFDDIHFASLITPALTTVHVPTAQLGRQAVRQLMAHRPGSPLSDSLGCEVRVRTELVVRNSTARPAQ